MFYLPPQIGRYQIKSLIGRGGMGNLYLAHDPNTDRLVALKLLNATLDSSELRERFAREARALAALNHPNIVNIYDTGEFDDSPFIVMEYVRGEALDEMIKRRAPLSVAQKLKLMSELCAGLAQAHEAGIIHRDIKPANLMVDQQGRLKILDFGIARVAEGNRTRVGPITQVNMMIGTPGYMSPEQIEGGEVDHRSDIFAVGAVCYELFSYSEAFSGANTRQIERRVLQAKPASLASVVPGLDPEIDEIVQRALKRDPNKRYQDAATFEKALDRVRARMEPEPQGERRPTPPPPQGSRGNTRPARADAAYQHALAASQRGAVTVARRFALEALAEDPSHADARALLARLEAKPSPSGPPPPPPRSAPPAAVATAVGTAVGNADTLVGNPQTYVSRVGPSAINAAHTMASAPTIIIAPAKEPATTRWRVPATWRGGALKRRYEALWNRDRTPWKGQEPLWMRYRRPIEVVALLLVLSLILMIVIRFGVGYRPSGQLLTIAKPVGGTLSAPGINCGTRGSDCSVNRPNGDPIELTPEADAGFTFAGYTGDCAPGGRTIMTVARNCGANFAPVAAVVGPPPGTTQLLTIAPVPTGGTLEGVDIICGTKGSVCSASHPDGVPVELHPTADPGFTFMGFLGDCVPLGHTQMTGPRTCGATFSPTAVANAITTTVPKPTRSNTGRSQSDPGGDSASQGARGGSPSTSPPSQPPVVRVVEEPKAPVAPVITDEDFAKGKIQEILKAYCDAVEALDPDAVQRVQPRAPMKELKNQLSPSKYKSVQCKFGDPKFVSLDTSAGTAKVQAELKRVYEHTILTEKPQTDELIADITLFRSNLRSPWLIGEMTFKPK
jgi:serine/threonine protein kinase